MRAALARARRRPRPSCARIEPDAALGNGGLGRLAACFMDSMATLSIAAHGYGIRYDHGLFRQVIRDGWQQETPEDWLANGNPWEFERPEVQLRDRLRRLGRRRCTATTSARATSGTRPKRSRRSPTTRRSSAGAGTHVNTLRLWSARAPDPFRLDAFNAGDHVGALADRVRAEAISKVLYPSDATPAGQELRLRQEYFFASASLQDLVRRHVKQHRRHPHARRTRRDPAQRHPSGDRRRRADAHSGRPATASTGTRPGRSRRRRSPTPTTRCCPRRWRAGRCR